MTSIIHEPAPNPSTSQKKTTCQRGQSGPRVQSGRVRSGQFPSSHVPKKKAPGFSFSSRTSPLLFPFDSFPCGLCTRFKHMAAVQPNQIHFCTLHSLEVLRFFRYFGNLRVPSRVNTMYTVQYSMYVVQKTQPTRNQTNDRFHVSFRFSFTEMMN